MLRVDVCSFGYVRSGVPADESGHGGGFVFDCRALPNPGRELRFAGRSGLDEDVAAWLAASPEVEAFLESAWRLVEQSVRAYRAREFTRLSVAFGCTGGQHRSVYCAERVAARLRALGVETRVTHRERGRWW
jgi:RNase adaptor protein for sRNA GlmZ degradation